MTYGMIVNGRLQIAPRKIIWHGRQVFNPSPEKLTELGYKPVIYTEPPYEPPDGYTWQSAWAEDQEQITENWILVEIQE